MRLLAVLALINFVNFAARQAVVPLIPLLRDHLHATDAQLGDLQTWLLVVLAIASIPFGFLADRFSRKSIIATGIICWSVASFAGGLFSTFLYFLSARALVGLGEAAYAPAAQSMIGIFPGLALLGIEEPPRGPRSEVVPIPRLLSVPAFVSLIAAGICITFSSVSLISWGVDFAVNYKDFSLREASVSLALVTLFALVLGVLAGGYVADRLQRSFVYGRIIAVAAAFLLAAPFLLLAIQSEEKSTVLVGFFIASFFMSWYHGPVTAVLHDQ